MPGPRYRPFASPPYRIAMGLESLDPADWIEIDGTYEHQMAEKRRLLAERHADVFAALPEATPACEEVLQMLRAHLCARFPNRFATIEDDPGQHPLERAARLVQEDLCLMQKGVEGYVLTAACVCFPSRWNLSEKFARPMRAIHAPVPLYEQKLARPVDRFFDHLTVDRPVWRSNFSLMDDATLFQPAGHGRHGRDETITPETAADRIVLRSERQTLRRLPQTGAILFTIRIHTEPLSVFAEDPAAASDLAATVRTMPEAVFDYKSLPVSADAVLGYLDAIAGQGRSGHADE